MPSKAPRLRFHAQWDDDVPPSRLMSGGWWLFCVFGLSIGYGAWYYGRTYLRQHLASELNGATNQADAGAAIESLKRVEPDIVPRLVAALAASSKVPSCAAFAALDQEVSRWNLIAPTDRSKHYRQLAEQLQALPSALNNEQSILASGLASRVCALVMADETEDGNQVKQMCREVIRRCGASLSTSKLNTQSIADSSLPQAATGEIGNSPVALTVPPPPLPPLESDARSAQAQLSDIEPADLPAQTLAATEIVGAMPQSVLGQSPTPGVTETSTAVADGSMRLISIGTAASSTGTPQLTGSSDSTVSEIEKRAVSAERFGDIQQELPIGMESLSPAELVRLLGSVQPRVTQAAALLLRKRGMSEERLTLACELATGTAESRLQAIDTLARNDSLDPRPWLLWMAQDGQVEVRARSVSILANMLDVDVERQLRLQLNRERDETVADAIRRVLVSAGKK